MRERRVIFSTALHPGSHWRSAAPFDQRQVFVPQRSAVLPTPLRSSFGPLPVLLRCPPPANPPPCLSFQCAFRRSPPRWSHHPPSVLPGQASPSRRRQGRRPPP